jgi:hypothetical protein
MGVAEISAKAQQIRKKSPNKAWQTCISEASKLLKGTHSSAPKKTVKKAIGKAKKVAPVRSAAPTKPPKAKTKIKIKSGNVSLKIGGISSNSMQQLTTAVARLEQLQAHKISLATHGKRKDLTPQEKTAMRQESEKTAKLIIAQKALITALKRAI